MSDNLEFYEAFAPYYETYYAGTDANATVSEWQSLLVGGRLLPMAGAPTLIDLGCGPGWHLRPWQKAGFLVSGLDGSPAMLRRAAAHAEAGPGTDITLYCADLRNVASLAALAGRFDVAVAHFNFLHLVAPDELTAVFQGIAHLLKSKGIFVTDHVLQPSEADMNSLCETESVATGCTRRIGEITKQGVRIDWVIEGQSHVELYWFHQLATLVQSARSAGLSLEATQSSELLAFSR